MSKREWINNFLDGEVLLMEPPDFDAALIGVGYRGGSTEFFAVYDERRVLAVLAKMGMSVDDAREHFDFNIAGGWVGGATPAFLMPAEEGEADE